MTGHFSERTRWAIVMAFAIAMAWVEAASVTYIRALVGRIELPTTFNWPLFWVALLLMASPALHHIARVPAKKSAFRRR
jgi:hypothetical protein